MLRAVPFTHTHTNTSASSHATTAEPVPPELRQRAREGNETSVLAAPSFSWYKRGLAEKLFFLFCGYVSAYHLRESPLHAPTSSLLLSLSRLLHRRTKHIFPPSNHNTYRDTHTHVRTDTFMQSLMLLRRAAHPVWTSALRRSLPTTTATIPTAAAAAASLTSPCTTQRAPKGDYGFNVFHNSNPQHGGSYARHERRMRDDEVEDFLKSVKHWTPVHEDVASNDVMDGEDNDDGTSSSQSGASSVSAAPPAASSLRMGEEAIMRTFTFDTYREAYLFMGRVWAFCYGSDKYPHVTWEGTSITVYLYSPSFRGLSKREARLAAFLNDQYNMGRKSKQQQRRIVDGIVQNATVEEMMGDAVAQVLAQRHTRRTAPLREVKEGPAKWSASISGDTTATRRAGERVEGVQAQGGAPDHTTATTTTTTTTTATAPRRG